MFAGLAVFIPLALAQLPQGSHSVVKYTLRSTYSVTGQAVSDLTQADGDRHRYKWLYVVYFLYKPFWSPDAWQAKYVWTACDGKTIVQGHAKVDGTQQYFMRKGYNLNRAKDRGEEHMCLIKYNVEKVDSHSTPLVQWSDPPDPKAPGAPGKQYMPVTMQMTLDHYEWYDVPGNVMPLSDSAFEGIIGTAWADTDRWHLDP
ncbi:hypothetical protein MRB53_039150 [Persea americana]|nr:hypothetical protein MRB53_039150 [Persea americana]